ncbi:MAG: hypothetical protein GXO19_05690 [Epsilonproteobacteria bacterium]|nr:hypothetical protein [Campylobacterota bacterium]NPA57208.1 hypothetical protein [Campylobacterota bacterium]
MLDWVLYIHILAATVWIGGSIFLFTLGIFLRDKEAQEQVYYHIGPLYGYMESVWLTVLIATGLWMFYHLGIDNVVRHWTPPHFAYVMVVKLVLVALITIFTAIHMYIAFKTHGRERTKMEKLLSRSSSMAIFLLNLIIIWFAMQVRGAL